MDKVTGSKSEARWASVRVSPFDCEYEIERLKGKIGKLEDKFTLSFFIIAILIMIIFLIIR
jgi:hypothetical protein